MSPEETARFRRGDAEQFRTIVTLHSPRLMAVCRGFALDADGAHDLLQETWMRVFTRRRTYRGGSLAAWLYAVCRSVCLSASRRAPPPSRAGGAVADPGGLAAETAGGPSPSDQAAAAELRHAIARALCDLSDRQRDAVVHRLILGRSTRETAALMGCAEGTVKATLSQALGRLAAPLRAHSPHDAVTVDP